MLKNIMLQLQKLVGMCNPGAVYLRAVHRVILHMLDCLQCPCSA